MNDDRVGNTIYSVSVGNEITVLHNTFYRGIENGENILAFGYLCDVSVSRELHFFLLT